MPVKQRQGAAPAPVQSIGSATLNGTKPQLILLIKPCVYLRFHVNMATVKKG